MSRQKYLEKVENNGSKNIKYYWNYGNYLSKSHGIPEEIFLNNSKADYKDIYKLC